MSLNKQIHFKFHYLGQSMSDTMSSIMEDQTAIETVHPVSIAEDGSETLSYDDVNEIDDLINEAVEFESCMSISNEAEMSTVKSFKSANKRKYYWAFLKIMFISFHLPF